MLAVMAIYHFSTRPIGRRQGLNAVAQAATCSGSALRDARTGLLYDFSDRAGVDYSAVVLPAHADKACLRWAADREQLWNAAEAAECRRNSCVAREYELAVPHELNLLQRIQLVHDYAQELANRYHVACDVSVHAAPPDGDPRNLFAYILTTTRVLTPTSLGPKAVPEFGDRERAGRGLPSARAELIHLRGRWAADANYALERAGSVVRIDHRRLREQGIDRIPEPRRNPVSRSSDAATCARIEPPATGTNLMRHRD
jgi:ATP-dependent exoDNAse (exonuclease V) alpha subunit